MAISEIYTGQDLQIIAVQIPNGGSVSDLFKLPQGMSLVGLIPPTAWTPADLALMVATSRADEPDGPVMGLGGTSYLKCQITAGVPVAFPFADSVLWPYLQLLSCTAGDPSDVTPVDQLADRTIRLVLRKLFN